MASLRKLFLIPTALVALAGIASAAAPNINCDLTTPVSTGVLRSEGRTELLPQISLTCTPTGALTLPVAFQLSVIATGGAIFTSPASPAAKAATVTVGDTVTTGVPSAGVIVFPGVSLVTVAGPTYTVLIDNLYVDATQIPQGSTIGLNVVAVSSNTLVSDSKIFGVSPFSPVLAVPNVGITTKSLTVTDLVDPKNPTSLKACANDKFDVTLNGSLVAPFGNGTLFDTITFTPVLTNSFQSLGRLEITVSNLPSGVQLYVPLHVTSASTVLDLLAGYNTTTLDGGYTAGTVAGGTDIYGLVPASGTIVYQITTPGMDPVSVQLFEVATGPVLAATPVSIKAGYAPVGGTTIPNFAAGTTVSSNFFTVDACASSLFFPYVIANPGYDTGIAISSSGDFGDASKAASGQCIVTFMGKDAPTDTKTLDVTVGQTNAFDIKGAMPTANFYGYAVAKCNFLNATGYAFVANTTGGTASYLPDRLDK